MRRGAVRGLRDGADAPLREVRLERIEDRLCRDADLTRKALGWPEAEGRMADADPEVIAKFGNEGLSDADIEALVNERTQAKRQRNFARADAIRNELLSKGILLEDSKDGVRWKRK